MTWLTTRLRRRLGVESGEERVFLWGAATLFLVDWAGVSITNVSETLFLKRVGVQWLPWVFLANSILLVATTFIFGRLAERLDQTVLLRRTFIGCALTLGTLWLLVASDATAVFVALVMASKQIESMALIIVWVTLGRMLHGRQSKRLSAPIMAGGTLGAIFGSFASGTVGKVLGVAAPLLMAAAAFLAAWILTTGVRRAAPARLDRTRAVAPSAVTPSPAGRATAFGRLWREGALFRIMALGTLLGGLLGPMLYFQFSYVADLATQGSNGEQRLLDLYAQFRGWINVAVLVVQSMGTSMLFRAAGVPLAAALSPVIYLLGFIGLSVRLSLPAGIGAVAGARLQDHAIYDPAQKMLYTLFRDAVRPAVIALIDGPVKRLGGMLGNVVVLAALALGTPVWVGYVALPIAATWLVFAIGLWRLYPSLLLEASATRRSGDVIPLDQMMDARTVQTLEATLIDPAPERCRAACRLVSEASPRLALGALARALRRAPPPNRTLVAETIDRLLDRADAPATHRGAAREIASALDDLDLDDATRATLVRAYGRLASTTASDPHTREVLTRLRDGGSPVLRLAVAGALHRGGDPEWGAEAFDGVLDRALDGDGTDARHAAREELRALLLARRAPAGDGARFATHLHRLSTLLADPAERIAAAGALAAVAERHGARAAPAAPVVLAHATDTDPAVRAAVLRFVGHARLHQHVSLVVERLSADDEEEATAAAEALRELGPSVTDVLLSTLHFGKRSARNGVLAILRETTIDRSTLLALLDGELNCMRRSLVLAHALGGTAADSPLVQLRLHERVGESMHTALLLLATLLRDERVTRLCRLLERTHGRSERAVLLEALEALLPPEQSSRLMPLLDDGDTETLARTASRGLGEPPPAPDDAVRHALADDDGLTRAFTLAALDAGGLARYGAAREAEVVRTVEIVLHLRSLDLFERLTTRQLSELAAVVTEEPHAAGSVIVREGAFDDCMYLIVRGRVSITRQGQPLAELGPRHFFGEMAVFDGETRSATATALTETQLLRLERHDLLQVMDEQPGIAIAVCQTLTRRIRDLNARLQVGPDARPSR